MAAAGRVQQQLQVFGAVIVVRQVNVGGNMVCERLNWLSGWDVGGCTANRLRMPTRTV